MCARRAELKGRTSCVSVLTHTDTFQYRACELRPSTALYIPPDRYIYLVTAATACLARKLAIPTPSPIPHRWSAHICSSSFYSCSSYSSLSSWSSLGLGVSSSTAASALRVVFRMCRSTSAIRARIAASRTPDAKPIEYTVAVVWQSHERGSSSSSKGLMQHRVP